MRWFSTFSKRHKIDKHCSAGLNFPSAAVIRLLVSLNERKMGVLKLRDIYQFACLTNLLSAQFSDHSLSYFPTTLFKFDVNNSLWCSPTTLFKLEFNLFSRRQKFAQLIRKVTWRFYSIYPSTVTALETESWECNNIALELSLTTEAQVPNPRQ